MDFLKELFNDKPLTFAELEAAAKAKGDALNVVNAAKGAYLSKTDADAATSALTGQLTAANSTITDLQKKVAEFDGVDVAALKSAADTLKTDYEKQLHDLKFNHALEKAVGGAKARDFKSVAAHLEVDKIKLDGEKLLGLDGQLEDLKKNKSFLFEVEGGQGGTGGNNNDNETRVPAIEHGTPPGAADGYSAFLEGAGLKE